MDLQSKENYYLLSSAQIQEINNLTGSFGTALAEILHRRLVRDNPDYPSWAVNSFKEKAQKAIFNRDEPLSSEEK